ncbi:hypothetical protein K7H91_14755 [Martelella mediterranea]|uniref:hypothetical protein n=1 Tax=Martelella mediterranea TaxID=293089 RepID=UPI001E3B0220|nr:hypothetical protein [Martelella mediterranea]MCD1635029.1 hypothetical protein [Martelella mediterranea]
MSKSHATLLFVFGSMLLTAMPAMANPTLSIVAVSQADSIEEEPFSLYDVNLLYHAASQTKLTCVTTQESGNNACTPGTIDLPDFSSLNIYTAAGGSIHGYDMMTTLQADDADCDFNVRIDPAQNQWSVTVSDMDACTASPVSGRLLTILYRYDSRTLEEITDAGGFLPWGTNSNLADHLTGESLAKDNKTSQFISASASLKGMFTYLWTTGMGKSLVKNASNKPSTPLWVYKLRASNSFYNQLQSLRAYRNWRHVEIRTKGGGWFKPANDPNLALMEEWDSLGAVPLSSIISVTPYTPHATEIIQAGPEIPNPAYRTYFTNPAMAPLPMQDSDFQSKRWRVYVPRGPALDDEADMETLAGDDAEYITPVSPRWCPSGMNLPQDDAFMPCLWDRLKLESYPVRVEP